MRVVVPLFLIVAVFLSACGGDDDSGSPVRPASVTPGGRDGAALSAESTPSPEATPVPEITPSPVPTATPGRTPPPADGGIVDETEAIIAVLLQNARALEQEDYDAALAAIDPTSPLYEGTASLTRQIFEMYDLTYDLSGLEVISQSGSEAEVRFTQVTRKVSGPEFRDNVVEGVHVMRKSDGVWRVYNTRVDSIEYLN